MWMKLVGIGAATVLATGVTSATMMRGAVPSHYKHDVNVGGTVSVTVDITVHTPDLEKLKPGTLIPDRITIVLPEGFTLRLPDSKQTVDVKTPTDYTATVKQQP